MMSDLWLSKANDIVNSYRDEWDKYPFGSRARDKVMKALFEKHTDISQAFIDEVIYLFECAYFDDDDVDLGEKVGIDNPTWEHQPDAFLMFRAIHQLWSYNNCLTFEKPICTI
jgi:hypothetical protein